MGGTGDHAGPVGGAIIQSEWGWPRIAGSNALVCAGYVFFAWLVDLFFSAFGLFPAPIWPSAGLALVAVMIGGVAQWPGVFVGSLLANYYLFEPPLWAAAAISVSNTLGPWVAARLITRAGADRPPFAAFYHVLVFVLYGIVGHSLVVGAHGAFVVSLLNDWTLREGFSSFIRWMLADASGTLFVAPTILLWLDSLRERGQRFTGHTLGAGVVMLLVTLVAAFFFFGLDGNGADGVSALPYLLVAPLIWGAVRLPLRDVYTTVTVLAIIATIGTVMGLGPFNRSGVENPLIALGLMVVTLALTVLSVGAITAERRRYAERLAEANQELERRVAERTRGLQQAAHEAGEANRAKSRFLATVGHEVRTPMTTILGTAELLRGAGLDGEKRKLLEILSSSGEHLLSIFDRVLDFACLEQDRVALDQEAFDLKQLVEEAVAIARPARGEGMVELRVETGELPPRVVGDAGRLRQVMVNLITNALRYTEEGSVMVRADVLESADGRCPFHFEVQDTGPGIAPAEQDRIFRPFEQVEGGWSGDGGAGLGLAICKELIDLMDGVIAVESDPGRGSLFWFVVDLVVSGKEPVPAAGDVVPGPFHILLVEDAAQNREIIRRLLARDGHRLVAVADGEAAVGAAAEQVFDWIVMDVQLPDMDGVEATARIRAQPAAQRPGIVGLTASVTAAVQGRARAAGMDAVLAKPLRRSELYATMGRLRAGAQGDPEATVPATAAPLLDEALLAEYDASLTAAERSELTTRYCRALEGDEAALREAWAAGDLAAVGRTAHKLSGSAAAVGFSALSGLVLQVEQAAAEADEGRVRILLERFGGVRAETLAAFSHRSGGQK